MPDAAPRGDSLYIYLFIVFYLLHIHILFNYFPLYVYCTILFITFNIRMQGKRRLFLELWLLWRPLYNQVNQSDQCVPVLEWFLLFTSFCGCLLSAAGPKVRNGCCVAYINEESPQGAASGLRSSLFFGWLLMSLLSFYHVQFGWNFNMLVSELAGLNWPEELTIYGLRPDLKVLKFWL